MNEAQLNRLLSSKNEVQKRIDEYIENELLARREADKNEILGHVEKAKHNLAFVADTVKQGHGDWAIVGCYYALYHIALALIMRKGYFSKNHDATLLVIIKEYYKKEIDDADLSLINQVFLDSQDIMFYVQSKTEREKASYSSKIVFDEKLINEVKLKTILFLNKCLGILRT